MRFHRPVPLRGRPTVSVVIPCYDYGRYLPVAVGGALAQDHVDVEVIVVDDCSTDDSVEVARRLAEDDDRIRLIEHATNRGHIATYNDGLAEVKGDYVVLMSADDTLPHNALTRAVSLMEAHPSVGLVFGYPHAFGEEVPEVPDRTRSWTVWSGGSWLRRACRTGRNVVMSPEVVLRRQAWDEIGEYDARLPHAADMAVWLDTALRWDIGRVNGPVQALYRVHGANMHLNHSEGLMLRDLRERHQVFEKVLVEGRPLPPDVDALRGLAGRAVAVEALRQVLGTASMPSDVAEAEPFRELAREAWPEVTGTRLWERTVAPETRRAPVAAVSRVVTSSRRAVAWHAWQRYGL